MAKSATYKVRAANLNTYSVFKSSGKFYMVAHGEAHAQRLVASLNRDAAEASAARKAKYKGKMV